jgi:hypothetical protein
MEVSDPVRRLCAAVAADGPDDARRPLVRTVEDASIAAGLGEAALQTLPTGVLLVLNPGVNEARVVTDLTRELRNALWRRNRRHDDGHRLRCRVSYHQGLVRLTDAGFEGQAVTVADDLCACDDLRAVLAADPERDLAMIISGNLLDDLAYPEAGGLSRRQFRPVTVATRDRVVPAYIYTHEHPA